MFLYVLSLKWLHNLNNNYLNYLKSTNGLNVKSKWAKPNAYMLHEEPPAKNKKTVDFVTFVDLCSVLFQCLRIEIQREINQKRY